MVFNINLPVETVNGCKVTIINNSDNYPKHPYIGEVEIYPGTWTLSRWNSTGDNISDKTLNLRQARERSEVFIALLREGGATYALGAFSSIQELEEHVDSFYKKARIIGTNKVSLEEGVFINNESKTYL